MHGRVVSSWVMCMSLGALQTRKIYVTDNVRKQNKNKFKISYTCRQHGIIMIYSSFAFFNINKINVNFLGKLQSPLNFGIVLKFEKPLV